MSRLPSPFLTPDTTRAREKTWELQNSQARPQVCLLPRWSSRNRQHPSLHTASPAQASRACGTRQAANVAPLERLQVDTRCAISAPTYFRYDITIDCAPKRGQQGVFASSCTSASPLVFAILRPASNIHYKIILPPHTIQTVAAYCHTTKCPAEGPLRVSGTQAVLERRQVYRPPRG